MDCNKARTYLELRTLGHQSLDDLEAVAAQKHVSECATCQSAFESQQHFDREISGAMSDVIIPSGLEVRLKNLVGNEPASAPSAPAQIAPKQLHRVRFLPRIAASTGLAALLVWVVFLRVPALSEADVRHLAELDIEALPAATTDQAVPIPTGWNRVRGIHFGQTTKTATVGSRQFAALRITVHLRARSPETTGFLIRLPDYASSQSLGPFVSAPIQYSSSGSWIIWREGKTIYLCVLRDANSLERLRQAVANSRDLS